jgi:hypothetical protein
MAISKSAPRIALSSLYHHHVIELYKLSMIGMMSLLALLTSFYVFMYMDFSHFLEVYYLIPHMYLVPLILLCLWYPKSGIYLMTFITVVYFISSAIYYLFYTLYLDFFLLYFFSGLDLAFLIAVLLYVKDVHLVEAVITDILSSQDDNKSNYVSYSPEQFDFETDFEQVLVSLQSEDEETREDAVSRLSGTTDERIVLPLIYALRDPASNVRRAAARSLGRSQSATAVQPLIDALVDSDRGVRDTAAEALGHFGAHAHPLLMEALSSPQWEVRVGALIALRLIDVEVDPLKIVPYLADENRYVRREATKTVGRVGGMNILGDLEYALLDSDPGVRIRAINGIVRHADPLNMQRLFIPLLQDKDSTVRLRVNEELRKISRR